MHMKLWTGLYLHVILLGCTAAVVRCTWSYRLSNNNNNNHDNVCGALIVTKVIATVHPVHLMNADWAPGGANPQTKPTDRNNGSYHPHRSSPFCYYYSTHKLVVRKVNPEDKRRSTTSLRQYKRPVPRATQNLLTPQTLITQRPALIRSSIVSSRALSRLPRKPILLGRVNPISSRHWAANAIRGSCAGLTRLRWSPRQCWALAISVTPTRFDL